MPVSVWVPPAIHRLPPVPPPIPPSLMSPPNVVEPALIIRTFEPIRTLPLPDKVLIAAPVDVCEISNVPQPAPGGQAPGEPLTMTLEDCEIEPVPMSAS